MNWISPEQKPEFYERRVLLWIEWPECDWPSPPEPVIGWWKHGPACFAFDQYESADHLVKAWAEITEPSL